MNKYLEKVAGILPRMALRAAKDIGGTVKDMAGVGARAAKASRAKAFNEASARGANAVGNMAKARASTMTARGASNDVRLGNLDKAKFQADKAAAGAKLRSDRTAQAAALARKGGMRLAGGVAVAGGAGAGAAAAASKTKED